MNSKTSRRSFLQAALAAGAFPFVPALAGGKPWKPGDKVNLAVCGIGNQGWHDIQSFAKTGLCNIVALCDTDMGAKHTQNALKKFPNAKRFKDFRKMLEEMGGEIDAVAACTPDHAHFPIAMMAMRMGKGIFTEKPMGHTFREIGLMMAAEKKSGVATQMGNQGHSGANYYQFRDYRASGVLGEIKKVVAHMNSSRRWHKWNGNVNAMPPEMPIPETMGRDGWSVWLGTMPMRPYNRDYVNGDWRCWYDFGNGALGDWGAHILDTIHQFYDLGLPSEICISNVTGHNPFVFPMNNTLTFRFPSKPGRKGFDIEWYEGRQNLPELPKGYKTPKGQGYIPPPGGVAAAAKEKGFSLNPGKEIYMADGTIWQGGSHSSPLQRVGSNEKLPEYEKPGSNHYANFLLGVMGREKTRSPFSVAGPLSQMFTLGCIAQRLRRSIKIDPKTGAILNDAEATKYLAGPAAPRKEWEEFYKV
jgi:predicted dehydrogenase